MIRIILSFIVVLTIAGDSQTGAAPTANSVSAPDTILDTNTKQGAPYYYYYFCSLLCDLALTSIYFHIYNIQMQLSSFNVLTFVPPPAGVDAFETDIVLTDEQKNILLTPAAAQKNGNSIKDEAATGFDTDIWPNNVVPLVIDSDVGKYSYCVCRLIIIISDKDTIWNAAKYWEDKTCVSFVTRTDQVDYVHVKKSNGYVVAVQMTQILSLCTFYTISFVA